MGHLYLSHKKANMEDFAEIVGHPRVSHKNRKRRKLCDTFTCRIKRLLVCFEAPKGRLGNYCLFFILQYG